MDLKRGKFAKLLTFMIFGIERFKFPFTRRVFQASKHFARTFLHRGLINDINSPEYP